MELIVCPVYTVFDDLMALNIIYVLIALVGWVLLELQNHLSDYLTSSQGFLGVISNLTAPKLKS